MKNWKIRKELVVFNSYWNPKKAGSYSSKGISRGNNSIDEVISKSKEQTRKKLKSFPLSMSFCADWYQKVPPTFRMGYPMPVKEVKTTSADKPTGCRPIQYWQAFTKTFSSRLYVVSSWQLKLAIISLDWDFRLNYEHECIPPDLHRMLKTSFLVGGYSFIPCCSDVK